MALGANAVFKITPLHIHLAMWFLDEIGFINTNLKTISGLRNRVLTAHDNLQKISAQASLWNTIPLYQGKERKYDCLIPLEDRDNIKEARYREMVAAAKMILHLVAVGSNISSLFQNVVGNEPQTVSPGFHSTPRKISFCMTPTLTHLNGTPIRRLWRIWSSRV